MDQLTEFVDTVRMLTLGVGQLIAESLRHAQGMRIVETGDHRPAGRLEHPVSIELGEFVVVRQSEQAFDLLEVGVKLVGSQGPHPTTARQFCASQRLCRAVLSGS